MNSLPNRSLLPTLTHTLVLLLGVGSAMALSNPGTAGAAEESQTVSYQDLDLTRPADVRVLYHRLQRAASDVCDPVPAMELARHRAFEQCYRAALDQAVMQINAPQLLVLHQAESAAKG